MTKRKKRYIIWGAILFTLFMTGCKEDTQNSRWREGYIAIRKEESALPTPRMDGEGQGIYCQVLGRQFHHGETAQICAVRDGDSLEIGVYGEDGAWETLLSDAPAEYRTRWYLGKDGVGYALTGKTVIRVEGGEETCRWELGTVERGFCELPDGRAVALLYEEGKGAWLGCLDPVTGAVSRWGNVALENAPNQAISVRDGQVLVMDDTGVWKTAEEQGDSSGGQETGREYVMPFGTAYRPGDGVEDFRVTEDGRVEVLKRSGTLQRLELCAPEEVVVARMWYLDRWMEGCVNRFNNENGKYYVLVEQSEDQMDWSGMNEYQSRTAVEIATGAGADIVFSDALGEVDELIEAGAFENLVPYMERDGVREEEYFPGAFDVWKKDGNVYGACPVLAMTGRWLDERFIGEEESKIEELVDTMLAYDEEKVIFHTSWDGGLILNYFLSGTDDLWGMVDWEEGKCDFEGKLFARMLEVSKRYADDNTGRYHAMSDWLWTSSAYRFKTEVSRDYLKGEGKVPVGHFFDDGWHMGLHETNSTIVAISATSSNKEGAWEFIRYIMSEEVQASHKYESDYVSHRGAFEWVMENAMEEGPMIDKPNGMGKWFLVDGVDYYELGEEAYRELYTPTEEIIGEIRGHLEEARPFSLRTAPILRIIQEETGAYFAGDKEAEEVIGIIENRVGLYLKERQ